MNVLKFTFLRIVNTRFFFINLWKYQKGQQSIFEKEEFKLQELI